MISLLKPKHTLQSVALEIQSGLNEQNIFLNDQALNEAGYEAHTIESVPFLSSLGQIAFLAIPAIIYSLSIVFGFLISAPAWPNWLDRLDLLFIQFYVVLVHYFGHKVGSSQRRYITKKSSRRD